MMRKKDVEKEKHILVTSMHLFSAKSVNQISMQEIADECGVSKGSLYMYFKSKEDLLLQILKYFFHNMEGQILVVESDHNLSNMEKFKKGLTIKMNHYVKNQEFYKLQSKDLSGYLNNIIYQYFREQNTIQLKWFKKYLIKIYGQKIELYAADGAFLLAAIIRHYMELIFWKHFSLNVDKIVDYALTQLEFIIKGMNEKSMSPIMNESLWSLYLEEDTTKKKHPLKLLNKMKHHLEQEGIPSEQKEEAKASINIIEQELTSIQPRKVILKGMLHNLATIDSLKEYHQILQESLMVDR
ncbi:TetR/AcrR family transcriptional regulator [Gracilibacillus caseinilyticus]|uniref:TetR/AcrR family transcriptional regulator n=1 Tax=Gracilibacillus caseinilyticus TaxID=2932256 RepID=A0ABY4EXL9_9BACI|nr:TetR/AcrR family transcriptional regulator [Gracilibacillus caseinilyticus]UOQ49163.1 TetR/AcrR family transcriptional regulator [Gracilibacillus caseinilyticus]